MKTIKLLVVFALTNLSLCISVFSQDLITLIDGKTKTGIVMEYSGDYLLYKIDRKGNLITKGILKNEIYQISFKDSINEIVYQKNEEIGFNLTQEEMGNYVIGQQDARKNYKCPLVTIGGVAAGAAGGAGFIHPVYGIFVPAAYSGLIGLRNPVVKKKYVKNIDLIENGFFEDGYQYQASQKRIGNALKGSLVGFAVTVAIVALQAK